MRIASRLVRVAAASLAFLIVSTGAIPFAYSASGDVTAQVTLNGPSVACNHTLYGVARVINNLDNQITISSIQIVVLDNVLGRAYEQSFTFNYPLNKHSAQGFDFAFTQLTDIETQTDPEPVQVTAKAYYDVPPGGDILVSGIGSAGLSITGCPKGTPSNFSQSSSSSSVQNSSGGSTPAGIPEFPLQPVAMIAFVLLIVGAYFFARRQVTAR